VNVPVIPGLVVTNVEVIDTVGSMAREIAELRLVVAAVERVIAAADLLDESVIRLRRLKEEIGKARAGAVV
jgi:hypothetical protein